MRRLVHWILTRLGWAFEGSMPPDPKWIAIGAPHTSNWDFFVFLATLGHFDIEVSFLAKHTLFRWPLGGVFRRLGGIPVDRNKTGGIVDAVTDAFESRDEMILVIAPEGTRDMARSWKSGFLSIAEAAAVPVVFAGVDYETKTLTLADRVHFNGDVAGFMEKARGFYQDKRGLRPELETPVVLREELEAS